MIIEIENVTLDLAIIAARDLHAPDLRAMLIEIECDPSAMTNGDSTHYKVPLVKICALINALATTLAEGCAVAFQPNEMLEFLDSHNDTIDDATALSSLLSELPSQVCEKRLGYS